MRRLAILLSLTMMASVRPVDGQGRIGAVRTQASQRLAAIQQLRQSTPLRQQILNGPRRGASVLETGSPFSIVLTRDPKADAPPLAQLDRAVWAGLDRLESFYRNLTTEDGARAFLELLDGTSPGTRPPVPLLPDGVSITRMPAGGEGTGTTQDDCAPYPGGCPSPCTVLVETDSVLVRRPWTVIRGAAFDLEVDTLGWLDEWQTFKVGAVCN